MKKTYIIVNIKPVANNIILNAKPYTKNAYSSHSANLDHYPFITFYAIFYLYSCGVLTIRVPTFT